MSLSQHASTTDTNYSKVVKTRHQLTTVVGTIDSNSHFRRFLHRNLFLRINFAADITVLDSGKAVPEGLTFRTTERFIAARVDTVDGGSFVNANISRTTKAHAYTVEHIVRKYHDCLFQRVLRVLR